MVHIGGRCLRRKPTASSCNRMVFRIVTFRYFEIAGASTHLESASGLFRYPLTAMQDPVNEMMLVDLTCVLLSK